jgi:dolichyl-phosphate-mannose--protein O-mannosyl transferase
MKFFSFLILLNVCYSQDSNTVTCGSNVKLVHKDSKHHLHSHSIAWGSGSGQQSVTATGSQADPNSLWIIKENQKSQKSCDLSTPVLCGSTISLEHAGSGLFIIRYQRI